MVIDRIIGARSVSFAAPRKVGSDYPVLLGEDIDIVTPDGGRTAEPVDEDEGRPLARFQIMDHGIVSKHNSLTPNVNLCRSTR